MMTFEEILEIEAGLQQLKNEAVEIMANSPGDYWERSRIWYQQIKPRLIHLVGFMAEKHELRSCEAYDITYLGFLGILKL